MRSSIITAGLAITILACDHHAECPTPEPVPLVPESTTSSPRSACDLPIAADPSLNGPSAVG